MLFAEVEQRDVESGTRVVLTRANTVRSTINLYESEIDDLITYLLYYKKWVEEDGQAADATNY